MGESPPTGSSGSISSPAWSSSNRCEPRRNTGGWDWCAIDLTVGLNRLVSLDATRAKGQLRKRPPSRRASLSRQRLSVAGLEQGTWAEQGDHHSASTACDRMHVASATFHFSHPSNAGVRNPYL